MSIEAKWIWTEDTYRADVQAAWFRRAFDAGASDAPWTIHLTADTRYRAWWNGELLGRGPSCGDIGHWGYDTYKLEARSGLNVLAVEVLFQGQYELLKLPWLRPAMLCWSDAPDTNLLFASGARWKCLASEAHSPHPPVSQRILPGYTSVGAFEVIDGRKLPAGWTSAAFDDSAWKPAAELGIRPHRRDETGVQENSWELVPPTIPILTREPRGWRAALRCGAAGDSSDDAPLWQGRPEGALCDPPPFDPATGAMDWRTKGPAFLILDAGEMTTAFVALDVEGGEGTTVTMRYAESLSEGLRKSRRDERGTGTVEGYFDRYTLRAGPQTYEPFHWRPFRFLKIETDGPCRVRGLSMHRCTYPGDVAASFESSDPLLAKIWDTSWRTAQLCAHDAHDDCPYYEQLPYIGDLRLHGPLGMMLTGDRRLIERSIRFYSWARRPDGMIVTRYPARIPQIIPPFALIWIMLVEDFYRMTGDAGFVAEMWPTIVGILDWFKAREVPGDILARPFPYWNFTDWSLPQDEGREINAGNRASLILFYLGARRAAAALATAAGKDGVPLADSAEKLRRTIRGALLDKNRPLLKDDTGGGITATHQTILGILYGVFTENEAPKALDAVLAGTDLAQPTVPFLYYLFRAASRLGKYNKVWPKISLWKDMLDLGATTWFEMPEPTRSDCHAWSSWIARDLLTEVLGIQPLEPGYRTVMVRPQPANLSHASGGMPVPGGHVRVSWKTEGATMRAEVCLDGACRGGVFVAPDGEKFPLGPGKQEFSCRMPRPA